MAEPRSRRAFLAAAALAPLLGASTALAMAPGRGFAPVPDRPAARDFSLQDPQGAKHALSDYRGRVVLINFWATWCPPCIKEMPSLERLHRADPGLVVLGIDVGEDARTVTAFARRLDPRPGFPLLLDADGSVMRAFGARGLPTSFLLDREGRIAFWAAGAVEFDGPQVGALVHSLRGGSRPGTAALQRFINQPT